MSVSPIFHKTVYSGTIISEAKALGRKYICKCYNYNEHDNRVEHLGWLDINRVLINKLSEISLESNVFDLMHYICKLII